VCVINAARPRVRPGLSRDLPTLRALTMIPSAALQADDYSQHKEGSASNTVFGGDTHSSPMAAYLVVDFVELEGGALGRKR